MAIGRSSIIVAALTLVGAVSVVRAQLSVEEAYERLKARKVAAAATSQPATAPATQAGLSPAPAAPSTQPSPNAATAPVVATVEATVADPTTSPASTQPAAGSDAQIDDWHAQAVVLMRANRYDRAKPLLEKAFAARPLAIQPPSLIVNYCLIDVKQKSGAMRAVKTLMDYFRESSAVPSEKPVNLLAIALNIAIKTNPRVETTPLFKSAVARYEQLNAKLEASRPGYKRWGTQWISPEEYRQKKLARDEAQAAHAKVLGDINECAKDLEYATGDLARARAAASNFTYKTTAQSDAIQTAQSTVQFATDRLARLKVLAEKARLAIPAISWPETMEPVEP